MTFERLQRNVYDQLFAFKWSNAQPRWDDGHRNALADRQAGGVERLTSSDADDRRDRSQSDYEEFVTAFATG